MASRGLAVAVIDMQNDFLDNGAPLEFPEGRTIIPNIKRLLDEARKAGVPIIHIMTVWRKDGSDVGRFTSNPAIKNGLREGTRGAEVTEELKPQPGDYQVIKKRYSGFFQTDLEMLLRSLKVTEIIFAGIATNLCVGSTVRDAAFRDLMSYIPRDCCAALKEDEQIVALREFDRDFGKVVSLDEAISLLRSASGAARSPERAVARSS
jgi:nicotinamidase-related amidase